MINAPDAIILGQALRLQRFLAQQQHDLVLVASDKRLLRAASMEHLPSMDPEICSGGELRDLI